MEEFMLIFRHEDGKKVASPEQIHELRLGLKLVICSRGSTVHSPRKGSRASPGRSLITDPLQRAIRNKLRRAQPTFASTRNPPQASAGAADSDFSYEKQIYAAHESTHH